MNREFLTLSFVINKVKGKDGLEDGKRQRRFPKTLICRMDSSDPRLCNRGGRQRRFRKEEDILWQVSIMQKPRIC
jgi:hypothetical protein